MTLVTPLLACASPSKDTGDVPPLAEAGGYLVTTATATASGGRVFVGEGETPTLRRYTPDADGALVEDGTSSFLDDGLGIAARYAEIVELFRVPGWSFQRSAVR